MLHAGANSAPVGLQFKCYLPTIQRLAGGGFLPDRFHQPHARCVPVSLFNFHNGQAYVVSCIGEFITLENDTHTFIKSSCGYRYNICHGLDSRRHGDLCPDMEFRLLRWAGLDQGTRDGYILPLFADNEREPEDRVFQVNTMHARTVVLFTSHQAYTLIINHKIFIGTVQQAPHMEFMPTFFFESKIFDRIDPFKITVHGLIGHLVAPVFTARQRVIIIRRAPAPR